ncbi:hypothetical protein HGRIS_007771 [Hohenbuehelia grisea]|uniref:Peroxisomal biogenesis factor 11 n=1 Tax=Hohenbuehelia grisea TaxID=104357 RepID=A0ABR3J5V8_9AGAR
MASVASQVILHPVVSQSLAMGGSTVGRDKTYRAIQYFARFYAWVLLRRGNKDDAARWSALKSHLAIARKLMRLGKPMEHLQATMKAVMSSGTASEQATTICRQLGYFGYLTYDAVVWANTIKFLKLSPETSAKVSRMANRFWVIGILSSIVHAVLKNARLTGEIKRLKASKPWGEKDLGEQVERETKLAAAFSARENLKTQFYIDILDLWNPATSLGYVHFNDGVIGIFGLVSSILGFQKQWQAVQAKNKK